MGLEDIQFDKLNDILVKDVMDTDYPVVREDFELEDVLRMLIHASFVSVVDENCKFVGIVTRQEILTGTNRIVHNFEWEYDVSEKQPETV